MNHSMINSSVTMGGLMRKLDLIANNVANLNTDGFKRKEATFEDLLTTYKQQHASQQLDGRLTPPNMIIGSGARLSQVQLNMSQGSLRRTENPFDVAIEGDALFEIGIPGRDADGNVTYQQAWTRNGAFRIALVQGNDESGMLTTNDGSVVIGDDDQPIYVPNGRSLTIDHIGNIFAYQTDTTNATPEFVGRLKLVRASRPQMLETRGENTFVLPGEITGNPAQVAAIMQRVDLEGTEELSSPIRLRQGFLEGSNVELSAEMTELIQVQRAFQLNARALTSSDTMMNLANNLRS